MPTKNRCHQFCSPQCALKGATSPRAIAPRTHRAGLPRAGGGRRPKPTASRLRRAKPSRALPPLTQAPNRRRAAHRPAASPRDGGTNGRQKPTAPPFAALLSPLLRGPPQRKSRGSAPAGSQSELRTFVPPPTPRPLSALRGTNARADWLRRTLLAVRPPRAKKTTVAQRPKKPEGRRRAGRRPTAARYPYGQRPRESEVAARPGPPNGEAKQPRASRPSLPHGGSRPPPLVVILVTSGAP